MNAMLEHRMALLAQCPLPPPDLPDAEAAKRPIHVTEWGNTGPTVLIVHGGVQGGLGGGPDIFLQQQSLATGGWRLRLPARPEFGKSPSRGIDDMTADSVWIADMLGDGAHLIGHSWGGAGALLAAARRPGAVRSLILIEPAMQPLLMGSSEIASSPAVRDDAMRVAGALMAARSPGEYALAFMSGLGAASAESTARATALRTNPQLAAEIGCALLQARMASPDAMRHAAETVAQAKIPVLVVTGGWSPSFDAIGAIAARLPLGRHVVVPAPDHFVQQSNAGEFNKIAGSFMCQAQDRP